MSVAKLCNDVLLGYLIGVGVGAGLAFVGILVVLVYVIKKKKENSPADYYRVQDEAWVGRGANESARNISQSELKV